jgi:hypothetical protein
MTGLDAANEEKRTHIYMRDIPFASVPMRVMFRAKWMLIYDAGVWAFISTTDRPNAWFSRIQWMSECHGAYGDCSRFSSQWAALSCHWFMSVSLDDIYKFVFG